MSLLKRAFVRSLARVADAGLEGYARSKSRQRAEDASGGDATSGEEDPGDCLPCKAIERQKAAKAMVRSVLED